MTPKNLSCFLYGAGVAKFEDRPVPVIQDPHEVIVRIQFVGVCGSDVHFWTHGGIGGNTVSESRPLVMGHEASGTIYSVGSAVDSLQPGDNVAIEPGFSCRRCSVCKAGHYNLCPKMQFAACPPDTHGTLTKYFKIPADFCYKLPGGIGLDEAVLVEPLAVAIHAVRLVDVKPGQTVVIFGSGTIGLLSTAVAKAFGAKKAVAVDIMESKLEFAKKYNMSPTFRPDLTASAEENAERLIRENELGSGADCAIEASGAESSINIAIHALRRGGSFVQTGLGQPNISFPITRMSEKELHLHGCFRYGPGDYQLALELLEMKRISVRELISAVLPFEQTTQAWERTKRGDGIKTLIQGVRD